MGPHVGSIVFCSGPYCYIIAAINILFAVLTVPENLLILVALRRIAKKRQWSISNIFIASIALTDFFTGLICQPLHGYFVLRQENVEDPNKLSTKDTWLFLFLNYSSYFLCGASLLIVSFMSVDRYLAIAHSIKYRKISSRKRTVIIIAIIFVVTFVIPMFRFASKSTNIVFIGLLVLSVFVSLITTAVSYSLLLHAYRKHNKATKLVRENTKLTNQSSHFRRQQRQLTKSFALISGVLICMYLPQLILKPISIMLVSKDSHPPAIFIVLEDVFNTILYCNSFVNPVLYCLRNKDIRKQIQQLVCCEKDTLGRHATISTVSTTWRSIVSFRKSTHFSRKKPDNLTLTTLDKTHKFTDDYCDKISQKSYSPSVNSNGSCSPVDTGQTFISEMELENESVRRL